MSFTSKTIPSNVFMVDIETAGLAYGSAIIQIAAAEFDPTSGTILREWESKVSLVDCNALGLGTDPETLEFHRRAGTCFDQGIDLFRALNTLYVFLHLYTDEPEVWAWGLDFETLHLKAAAEAAHYGNDGLWKYWQGRDARTVWHIAFPGKKPDRRPHNALLDVRAQVKDLTAALNHLLS